MDYSTLTLPLGATAEAITNSAGNLPLGPHVGVRFTFPGHGEVFAMFRAGWPTPGDAMLMVQSQPLSTGKSQVQECALSRDQAESATSLVDAWLGALHDAGVHFGPIGSLPLAQWAAGQQRDVQAKAAGGLAK